MSTVIVALIPNGLILAIALGYAVGAVRMAGKGALIQQANAVESLSNVDVLCTDKTGTLTTNAIRFEALEPLKADEAELERAAGRVRRRRQRSEQVPPRRSPRRSRTTPRPVGGRDRPATDGARGAWCAKHDHGARRPAASR